MHPREQFVGWLALPGQRDGSVLEAVLLDMPITMPAVRQHMAAGSDSALQEAIQTARRSVGQHRKSGKSGHRRAARLSWRDVLDGHRYHRLVHVPPLAPRPRFATAHVTFDDLHYPTHGKSFPARRYSH